MIRRCQQYVPPVPPWLQISSLSSASPLVPPISTLLSNNETKLRSRFRKSNTEKTEAEDEIRTAKDNHQQQQQQQHLQLIQSQISTNFPKVISNTQKASVMVPLLDIKKAGEEEDPLDRLSILFTKRSDHLNQAAGEISFPGGHYDPTLDGNCLMKTAIRESFEELNHDSITHQQQSQHQHQDDYLGQKNILLHNFESNFIFLGQAEMIPSANLVPVTPYYTYFKYQLLHEDNKNSDATSTPSVQDLFPGNPDEVSQVFTMSINELLRVEDKMYLKRLGVEGPVYPTIKNGRIWGLTALILKPFLDKIVKPVFFDTNKPIISA